MKIWKQVETLTCGPGDYWTNATHHQLVMESLRPAPKAPQLVALHPYLLPPIPSPNKEINPSHFHTVPWFIAIQGLM